MSIAFGQGWWLVAIKTIWTPLRAEVRLSFSFLKNSQENNIYKENKEAMENWNLKLPLPPPPPLSFDVNFFLLFFLIYNIPSSSSSNYIVLGARFIMNLNWFPLHNVEDDDDTPKAFSDDKTCCIYIYTCTYIYCVIYITARSSSPAGYSRPH